MNYDTATDFELEVKLHTIVSKRPHVKAPNENQRIYFTSADDGDQVEIVNVPRYCTDWDATMPLAVEYGVELSPCFDGWWFAGVVKSYSYEEEVLDYSGITTCEHPLRAIVICLIKVLEAK